MTENEKGSGPGSEALGRRRFVQRLAADATVMAGRVQGLSQVLVGSIGAAGQAVVDDLEAIRAHDSGSTEDAIVAEAAPSPPPTVEPVPPSPVDPAKPPPAVLDADQSAILADAREAVMAVNDLVTGPHLGVVAIAWNGLAVVLAAIGHSRRATLLRADDRLALTIDGPGGTYLVIRGRATVLAGDAARDALRPLLAATGRSWDELIAEDPDRLAVLLVPEQVMTARRDPP
jgi:hypothetical protein